MIAMTETEYETIADQALDELREEVGVEKPELKKVDVQTA